jgi:transposase-like protein
MTITVLSGPERRRRWTSAEKLRIVEESLAPESVTREVARRHDVHPNQLYTWRRQARLGLLTCAGVAATTEGCRFVPVRLATKGGGALSPQPASGASPMIEVMLSNGRLLRLSQGVALAWVAALAEALERR